MTSKKKKEAIISLGFWSLIGLTLVFSSSVITILEGFGYSEPVATMLIVVGVLVFAYYNEKIAKQLVLVF